MRKEVRIILVITIFDASVAVCPFDQAAAVEEAMKAVAASGNAASGSGIWGPGMDAMSGAVNALENDPLLEELSDLTLDLTMEQRSLDSAGRRRGRDSLATTEHDEEEASLESRIDAGVQGDESSSSLHDEEEKEGNGVDEPEEENEEQIAAVAPGENDTGEDIVKGVLGADQGAATRRREAEGLADSVAAATAMEESPAQVRTATDDEDPPAVAKSENDTDYLEPSLNDSMSMLPFQEQVSLSLEAEDNGMLVLGRSGLRKKKVQALRDYLTARGLPIEDEDGSRYAKKELLEIVTDYLGM